MFEDGGVEKPLTPTTCHAITYRMFLFDANASNRRRSKLHESQAG
jgi:hypothetical protein